MKVRYIGNPGPDGEGVEILETGQTCKPGQVIEVPGELGERLCEQSVWEKAKEGKR